MCNVQKEIKHIIKTGKFEQLAALGHRGHRYIANHIQQVFADACKSGNLDTIAFVLQHDEHEDVELEPENLFAVCKAGKVDSLTFLFKRFSQKMEEFLMEPSVFLQMFKFAVQSGDLPTAKFLAEALREERLYVTSEFEYACTSDKLDIARFIAENQGVLFKKLDIHRYHDHIFKKSSRAIQLLLVDLDPTYHWRYHCGKKFDQLRNRVQDKLTVLQQEMSSEIFDQNVVDLIHGYIL